MLRLSKRALTWSGDIVPVETFCKDMYSGTAFFCHKYCQSNLKYYFISISVHNFYFPTYMLFSYSTHMCAKLNLYASW